MIEIDADRSEHSTDPGNIIPSLFVFHLFINFSIRVFHIDEA